MRNWLGAFIILVAASTCAADKPANPNASKQAYEKFKALAGTWQGKSTKGWNEQIQFNILAGGSAVEERSFDAHPGETMLTIVHMDGDRLMLTHYCAAKNQPRLLATSISADGNTIEFTFLDATNLPSREKGHMDKAVFHFIDDRHFTTKWTWYQDGKEKWLEEIRMERVSSSQKAAL
jgi:hypothetical protein